MKLRIPRFTRLKHIVHQPGVMDYGGYNGVLVFTVDGYPSNICFF